MLWLSIATFNDAKPRLKVVSCSVNQFVVNTNSTWAMRVTPTLTWQNMTAAERVTQGDRRLETISDYTKILNADLQNYGAPFVKKMI